MDTNTRVASGAGKAEPEILTPPGVTDGALGFIDLEFESLGNETTDTLFHTACGPITACFRGGATISRPYLGRSAS